MKPGSELWLDGGHNPAAGRALAQTLADLEERSPKPVHLIVGMMGLKDSAGFLAPFRGLARHVVTVPIPGAHEAPHAPETLAETARKVGLEAEWSTDVESALKRCEKLEAGAEAHPDLRLALSCGPCAGAAGRRRAAGELTRHCYPQKQNGPEPKPGAVLYSVRSAQAALAELIQSSSFFFCTSAPVCCAATWPFLNSIRVGMARMPYLPVTVGFWSTSSFTTLTLPRHLLRDLFERWCHGLARPAPLGKKVHENRFRGLQNLLLEGAVGHCICHMDGLLEGWAGARVCSSGKLGTPLASVKAT